MLIVIFFIDNDSFDYLFTSKSCGTYLSTVYIERERNDTYTTETDLKIIKEIKFKKTFGKNSGFCY